MAHNSQAQHTSIRVDGFICHCGRRVSCDENNLPKSKYWKDTFSHNMRIREQQYVEVYCCPAHGLEAYESKRYDQDSELDHSQHIIVGGCPDCSAMNKSSDWEHDANCSRRASYNKFHNAIQAKLNAAWEQEEPDDDWEPKI